MTRSRVAVPWGRVVLSRVSRIALMGLALLSLAGAGCGSRETARSSPRQQASSHVATSSSVSSSAPAASPSEPSASVLPLRSLTPALTVEGRLYGRDAQGRRYRVTMAVRSAPQRHKRAWAFARLAERLGCGDAVPPTQLWHLGAHQLATLAGRDSDTFKVLRRHLLIDHDGTTPMLLERIEQAKESKPGTVELLQLEDLAMQKEALTPSQLPQVRAWVCVQALDYIAGHVPRRHWLLHRESGLAQGIGNERAFSSYVAPNNTVPVLHRLSQVRRFPRALHSALLQRGQRDLPDSIDAEPFVDQVLGPRQRADIGDRMATVLTLIHARIEQLGEDEALAL